MSETTARASAPPSAHGGNPAHPAARGAGALGLAVGALGVVFGDIGTSPLYAMQTVFSLDHSRIKASQGDVYGVISLIFWSITVVVSIKYVAFILRADNDGEGGVMALAALARRVAGDRKKLVGFALGLAVLGASLFFGDSVITPAISVLSSVEGLQVVSPDLHDAVVPIGIVILAGLFAVQRFGTHLVGRFFGPIMILWFLVLAVTGLPKVIDHPSILRALSPTYIGSFVGDHPFLAFIALGAVVLSITGAEALYADMGHFGRSPIRRSWFFLVFPCLTINYLGQGALVLHEKGATANPFFLLSPHWARIPMVVLATLATVIASQAVISGAFSVSRQAVRLGFLPNITVRHTSTEESGQIYVPAVNWLVFGSVLILILAFRSSEKLASLYGFAVTGTFVIDTTLFLIVAATAWHWSKARLIAIGVLFGVVELAYFGANVAKIANGGWLPLGIAAVISTVMMTWQAGRRVVTARRRILEGPLQEFVDKVQAKSLTRVPGTGVFPHPSKETTPLALRANVMFNQVLHEHVVLISVKVENVPHIPLDERIEVDHLVHSDDGVVHLDIRFGFQDEQDVPAMIALAKGDGSELDFDAENATYFVSRLSLAIAQDDGDEPPDDRGVDAVECQMSTWRKRIFIGLAHNAANPSSRFNLPEDRTIVMGSHLEI